jgi:soluble lytic murein transglycosylase
MNRTKPMIPNAKSNGKASGVTRRFLRCLLLLLAVPLVVACNRNAAPPTVAPSLAPTFTPLPSPAPADVSAGAATTGSELPTASVVTAAADAAPTVILAPTAVLIATDTPVPPTAAPTLPPTAADPVPDDELLQAQTSYRYGEYAVARTVLTKLLDGGGLDAQARLDALFLMARLNLAENQYDQALSIIDMLVAEAASAGEPGADLTAKARFLRAQAFYALGQYDQAVPEYWAFLERFPTLAELVQQNIAAAYVALGDSAGAADSYRRAADALLVNTDDTVAYVQILENLAAIQEGVGRYNDAVAVYDEILATAQNPGYRADIQYKAAQALATAGDLPGAIDRWRATTAESPGATAAYAALIELVERDVEFDLYDRGYIDLLAGAWLPAVNAYTAYLDLVEPTDGRAGLALLGIGQAYLGLENPVEAIPYFQRVIAEYPGCSCYGQAWLDLARAQAVLGDGNAARKTLRTFAREHAEDPLAPEALWRSGLSALSEQNQVEAGLDLLALADAFPASERAPQALYTVGLGTIQENLPGQAANILARLQREYPDYRWDAVGYWLGRAYHASGEPDAGNAQWQAVVDRAPDIYHGIVAAQSLQGLAQSDGAMLGNVPRVAGAPSRLDGDDGSQAFAETWLAARIDSPQSPLSALPAAVAADPDFQMGRTLLELDQRRTGLLALERVYNRYKEDAGALYPLSLEFQRMGAYRLSLLSAARLMVLTQAGLIEDAPAFIQRLAYPKRFASLIEREAAAAGIDPLVYYSLVRQESLFEEGARSVAAAQGLAQIIPDTGNWVAERIGYPNYSNDLLYLPAVNLKFGAYYLDWARDYLDGNLLSALVGYNAGPGNADRWRETPGSDDPLYVETLEYREPRIYVQAILSNLYHYVRLYGN